MPGHFITLFKTYHFGFSDSLKIASNRYRSDWQLYYNFMVEESFGQRLTIKYLHQPG